jgi:hypothetical protein
VAVNVSADAVNADKVKQSAISRVAIMSHLG